MTYNYIQVSRGIAAMMVVAFHLGGAFSAEKYFGEPIFAQLFRFGSSGVYFFFVLSGFIIYFVHQKDLGKPAHLMRYLTRRVTRIYPSYWLVLVGVSGFALLWPAFRGSIPTDPWVILKTLLLVPQDPAVVGGTGAPVIIVAWSLHYEIVFYLIFAIFIVSRTAGLICFVALALWWLATLVGGPGPEFFLSFLKPHLFLIFAFGVASAWFAINRPVASPAYWLATGAVIYAACAAFEVGQTFDHALIRSPGRLEIVSLGYGVGSAILVVGMVAAERRWPRPVSKWLVRMGDASYVLYLLHFPLISACAKILSRFNGGLPWMIVSFGVVFVICCGASLAFHTYVERPLLSYLQRFGKSTKPATAAVAN